MSENFKFCPNCGTRLDLSAKFCVSCGQIQNGSAETKTAQTQDLPVTQDRNFLLLYMMNVRDLEVTKRCIQEIKKKEESQTIKKVKNILATEYWEEPKKPSPGHPAGAWICALIFLPLGIFLLSKHRYWSYGGFDSLLNSLYEFLGVIFIGASIISFIMAISFSIRKVSIMRNYSAECRKTDEHNKAEKAKEPEKNRQADIIRTEWNDREAYFEGETKKAEDLLADFYSMNILPTQYRNLASACYIYDYMSSSNETLESTLIHEHMENGIQRIEAKLDKIIYQLQELVYETRCIQQENQKFHNQMAEQNRRMLKSLKQTESNTLEAAQYSQLISNDMRTVAFFETVNYLEK